MRKDFLKKGMILGIIFLFAGSGVIHNINGSINKINWSNNIPEVIASKTLLNSPPICSNTMPIDGSINVSINIQNLSVEIFDLDGDSFDWRIETSPDIGSNYGYGESNGSKSCDVSSLEYSTKYYWYVNVTDPFGSNTWTKEVYSFTTGEKPQEEYIPTIAKIYIDIVQKIGGNEALIGIENVIGNIYNWSTLDNKVKIKWFIKNENSLNYGYSPIILKVRIREYQQNSFSPELLFWLTESGRIDTSGSRFIEVPIPIGDNNNSDEYCIDVEFIELDEMTMTAVILFSSLHARPFFVLRSSTFGIHQPET